MKEEQELIQTTDGELLAWMLEDIPEINTIRHTFTMQDLYKDLLQRSNQNFQ